MPANSMVKTPSLCARKRVFVLVGKSLFPTEEGTVQRLTQRPKGRWGHKRDVKRENGGSLKPMCLSEQARHGESYTALNPGSSGF